MPSPLRAAIPVVVAAFCSVTGAFAGPPQTLTPNVIGHYTGTFTAEGGTATPPLVLNILKEGSPGSRGNAHISGNFSDLAPGEFAPDKFQGTVDSSGGFSIHHYTGHLRVAMTSEMGSDGKSFTGFYRVIRPRSFFQEGTFQLTLQSP